MKRILVIKSFITVVASLLLFLNTLGCSAPVFTPPHTLEFKPPPKEVTVAKVCADYMANPAAADAEYQGKRLSFRNVEIEEAFVRMYTDRHGSISFVTEYLRAGIIRFELRDFSVAQQNVKAGYILNLTGTCEGYSVPRGMVMVTDCWVESVKGDLGLEGPGYDPY